MKHALQPVGKLLLAAPRLLQVALAGLDLLMHAGVAHTHAGAGDRLFLSFCAAMVTHLLVGHALSQAELPQGGVPGLFSFLVRHGGPIGRGSRVGRIGLDGLGFMIERRELFPLHQLLLGLAELFGRPAGRNAELLVQLLPLRFGIVDLLPEQLGLGGGGRRIARAVLVAPELERHAPANARQSEEAKEPAQRAGHHGPGEDQRHAEHEQRTQPYQ